MDYQVLKKEIVAHCIEEVSKKLEDLKKELLLVQESANSDTKSSMGDKYETGREMVMQEKGKLESQRGLYLKQLTTFKAIDLNKHFSKVELGSLVKTKQAIYFISTALGIIELEGQKVFVISAGAPIAQAMLGKGERDEFAFNGNSFELESIN
ncbi:MAG: hypothetical protein AB8B73_11670 [Ekhidna sp.]